MRRSALPSGSQSSRYSARLKRPCKATDVKHTYSPSRPVFPAIDSLQSDLKASQQVVNLSVSLFVFFQGVVPILWSGISEIYGRKIVYITAYILFTLAQLVCAVSKNQILFLIFRIVGAAGSSAGLVSEEDWDVPLPESCVPRRLTPVSMIFQP